MPYHTIPYHAVSYYITSYHTVTCHIILHVILPYCSNPHTCMRACMRTYPYTCLCIHGEKNQNTSTCRKHVFVYLFNAHSVPDFSAGCGDLHRGHQGLRPNHAVAGALHADCRKQRLIEIARLLRLGCRGTSREGNNATYQTTTIHSQSSMKFHVNLEERYNHEIQDICTNACTLWGRASRVEGLTFW